MDYQEATAEFRTPRGNTVTMRYRLGTSDWNILTSCLTEDQYGLGKVPPLTGYALDVGAHIGAVTAGLLVDNPDLIVFALEPLSDNLRLLWENAPEALVSEGAGSNHVTVPIHHGYVGSEKAEHNAFVGNLRRGEWDDEVIEVQGFALDEFTPLVLLKIDCEGGEYDFLDNPAVAEVELIVGEWHNLGGTKTRADLLALLDATHEVTFTGPEEGPGGFTAVRRA